MTAAHPAMDLARLAQLDAAAADVLGVLWRASWQAAVLAVMVLLVQWMLRGRLSARWRYNLWLLVLLRLLVPVTPQSPFSVFNLARHLPAPAPAQPAGVANTTFVTVEVSNSPKPLSVSPRPASVAVADATPPNPAADPELSAASIAPPHAPLPWRLILGSVWVIGTFVILARITYATIRLARAVRRMTPVDAPHVTELLAGCRAELSIRRHVAILAADGLPAPALTGVLRPRLLLPQNVLDAFAPAELRLILLHELAHLKRRDVFVNWIVSLLHALHWFNPVLWLAFARLRADRELATDELVLSRTGEAEQSAYGQTIIKLLHAFAQTRRRAPLVGAVGILEPAHTLRRRITMIAQFRHAQFRRHAKRWTALAAASMLALAGLGLTDATGPAGAARPAAAAAPRPPAAVEDHAADAAAPPPDLGMLMALASPAPAAPAAATGDRAATTGPAAGASGGAADVVAANTAAAQRKLGAVAPEVNLNAVAIGDAIDYVRDLTDLNVFVNWRALEATGIDRQAPVTVRLKNVPVEQALRFILRDASGGGGVALDYAVIDGVVHITTAEELASDVKVRVYNVERLLHNLPTTAPAGAAMGMGGMEAAADPNYEKAQRVIQIIRETVAPDSWRDAGGNVGSIREINGRLVVAQTETNHAQIAKLLEEIGGGSSGGAGAGGATAGGAAGGYSGGAGTGAAGSHEAVGAKH